MKGGTLDRSGFERVSDVAPKDPAWRHRSADERTPSDPIGSVAAHGQVYRPEIDGLRAVAVLAVVLFHADIAPFTGGFVGVDVFFVISGFLITSIIEKDVAAGRFSFARFYERRIRRIFPALAAMSLFSVVLAAVLLVPTDFAQVGKSLIAMALFASNLFFRQDLGVTGYFKAGASPQMLIHTWSLAVEEQFYMLLPPALLLLHRYAARFVLPILAAAAVASFIASVILVSRAPTEAFYLIWPRAWELLVGSLLAVRRLPALPNRFARELVTAVSAALILFTIFNYSDMTPFPGAAALPPCVGAALLLYVGDKGPTLAGALLSTRPFVFTGRISYSLYLWHWPIFAATKYMSGGYMSFLPARVAIVLSFAAAYLSFRFIETPFRTRWRGLPRFSIFAATAAVTLVLVLIGGAIVVDGGFPQRFSTKTRELIARNLERSMDVPVDGTCDNYRRDIESAADVHWCPIDPDAKHKILVWGDSHAGEMHALFETLYRDGALHGRGAVFASAPACVPSRSMERVGDTLHCQRLATFALERAEAADIDTILIYASGFRAARDGNLCRIKGDSCTVLTKEQASDQLAEDYDDSIRLLQREGKRVIVALTDPTYDRDIPHNEILRATMPAFGLLHPLVRDDMTMVRDKLATVAKRTGATVFDPRASLCVGDTCRYEDAGVSIYMDNDHIARSKLGVFHDGLIDALAASDAKPRP